MSAGIPSVISPTDCCATSCTDATSNQVPGPAGPAGADGTNGTDGVDAFTTLSANFTMPASLATAVATVADSTWASIGQVVYMQNAGWLRVTAKADATHMTLQNLETATAYTENVAPATVIAAPATISPGGLQGPAGSSAGITLNALSPTTTKGDLIIDNGANSPSANDIRLPVGSDGQIFAADSALAAGAGWKSSLPTSTTDNGIPRFDGTSGKPVPLQTSKIIITDNGAIQASGSGGNARGTDAVDLQVSRTLATQVASGNKSVICGGQNNTASSTDDFIGGGSGNSAGGGNSAVVGGAGNTANGAQSFIGGGTGNATSTNFSGVTCGTNNTASADSAFVGGGSSNTASAASATVGAGNANTASGTYSTVGGGSTNAATANSSVIAGGSGNNATATAAFVGGGSGNTANATSAAIAGGSGNEVTGTYGFVGGGDTNMATGNITAILGGARAVADKYGQQSQASGRFTNNGDAQSSVLIARNSTTDNTPTDLFLDGSSAKITIASDTTWTFDVLIVARRSDADDESAAYRLVGCIDRNGAVGTTALVGSITKTVIAEDTAAWDTTCTADTGSGALKITVTGENAKTIKWVARCVLVEVTA